MQINNSNRSDWQPIIGEETQSLMTCLGLPTESRVSVEQESLAVLANCVPPSAAAKKDTGLVIGYIQSGKTMSFTTVAALARDNDYQLIIVLSGITTNLFEQSSDRVERDLRIRSRSDRKWQFLKNPKDRLEVRQRVATALDWSDPLPGFEKQTVLITAMKNRTHLTHLAQLLKSLDLNNVPTLVIDDEADQASLNNLVRQGTESATYHRINEIRRLIPHHTFLQYTATPQALLLISLIDSLSPRFVSLLTPGASYTGGKAFFEQDFRLVVRIPPNEIPTKDDPLTEPPESLVEALRIFYIGVAVGLMQGSRGGNRNRSMLVHPSKETMQHANYIQWIRTIQETWDGLLNLSEYDADRSDLLEDFRAAHADLNSTAIDLPPFAQVEPYLRGAVKRTMVVEVNATQGRTPQIDWHQNYAFILVGGEVLNRGYTVEGLTVTYMPRGNGVGNADTIQQRARWFGYKAEYLGFCRVYLADETLDAYRSYVNHEENVREQMRALLSLGGSLSDWRRAFFLSPQLRPTRHEVLDRDYMRGNFSSNWFDTRAPHDSPEAIESNRELVRTFVSKLKLQPDEGHSGRTEPQKHLVAPEVALSFVYEQLLTLFRMARPSDSQRFTGVLLQVSHYLEEHPNAKCAVYQMSKGASRRRGLNDLDEILNLFQGPNPDKTGEIYPGDRQIRASQELTVQLHTLNLYEDKDLIASDVPALAVWVPKDMAANWIVQEQY